MSSIKETIKRLVDDVAQDRDIKDYRAFALWFLEDIEEMSREAAEDALIDGPWDGGRDAVDIDEEDGSLTIYQFKYSSNPIEIKKAFTDLQRGLQAEIQSAINAQQIRLIVVSMAPENDELLDLLRNNEAIVKKWLETIGSSADIAIEHFDLNKFTQLFEKLTGVNAQLNFREPPLGSGIGQLGVVDARVFKNLVDKDELLAFNIRKFLGIRKNNINWKILRSLESASEREKFWMLNNGLVCVYTASSIVNPSTVEFANLSIVNGAQTVNTIAKFLNDNPAAAEYPVWVVAKFVQVAEYDRKLALRLTVTSNTQNAVSYKDLRASEQSHEVLEAWFNTLGYKYQYKRGDTSKGVNVIPMKDLAQAYVAWQGQPNIAFSRAGSIFGENSDLYSSVYPEREILELSVSSNAAERMKFLEPRLVAFEMLNQIRSLIANEIKKDPSIKLWRSSAYHLLWMYAVLLREEGMTNYSIIRGKVPEMVTAGFDYLFSGIQEFARDRGLVIPKSLKSNDFIDNVNNQDWLSGSFFANKARKAILEKLK